MAVTVERHVVVNCDRFRLEHTATGVKLSWSGLKGNEESVGITDIREFAEMVAVFAAQLPKPKRVMKRRAKKAPDAEQTNSASAEA